MYRKNMSFVDDNTMDDDSDTSSDFSMWTIVDSQSNICNFEKMSKSVKSPIYQNAIPPFEPTWWEFTVEECCKTFADTCWSTLSHCIVEETLGQIATEIRLYQDDSLGFSLFQLFLHESNSWLEAMQCESAIRVLGITCNILLLKELPDNEGIQLVCSSAVQMFANQILFINEENKQVIDFRPWKGEIQCWLCFRSQCHEIGVDTENEQRQLESSTDGECSAAMNSYLVEKCQIKELVTIPAKSSQTNKT